MVFRNRRRGLVGSLEGVRLYVLLGGEGVLAGSGIMFCVRLRLVGSGVRDIIVYCA